MTTSRGDNAHSFKAHRPPGTSIGATGGAAVSSAAVGILALLALVVPRLNPYADPNNSPLAGAVGVTAMTAAVAVLSLVSVIIALAARLTGGSVGVRRATLILGLLNSVGLGLAIQGTGGLILSGYAVALVLPVALVAVGLLAFRRYSRARPWLLLGAVALAAGFWVLRGTYLPLLGKVLVAYAGEIPGVVAAVATLSCAGLWGSLLLRNESAALRPLLGWAARHRRLLTVLASLGPAPYVLLRLTWLTPWVRFTPEDVDGGVRIWGLLLGGGAILGMVLTIGLIRPWGKRFPRWFPVAGGRAVPPAAAIIPGAVVALMITAAAGPMIAMGIASGKGLLGLVMLPLWYWGPMLGLAVLGYAGHRAGLDANGPDAGRPTATGSTAIARPSTMNT